MLYVALMAVLTVVLYRLVCRAGWRDPARTPGRRFGMGAGRRGRVLTRSVMGELPCGVTENTNPGKSTKTTPRGLAIATCYDDFERVSDERR
jgi:hypothetical protein